MRDNEREGKERGEETEKEGERKKENGCVGRREVIRIEFSKVVTECETNFIFMSPSRHKVTIMRCSVKIEFRKVVMILVCLISRVFLQDVKFAHDNLII